MPLHLFRAPKSGIGVDLGTSYAKVVQLTEDARGISLTTYAIAHMPNSLVDKGATDAVSREAVLLRAMMQRAGVGRASVVSALPILSVFSTVLQLPAMPERDMDAAVKIAAQSSVPSPLQDMVLGWTLVGTPRDMESAQETAGLDQELSTVVGTGSTAFSRPPAIRASLAQTDSPHASSVPGTPSAALPGRAPPGSQGTSFFGRVQSASVAAKGPSPDGQGEGSRTAPGESPGEGTGSPLGGSETAGKPVRRKMQEVFLTAAPRELVGRYTALFDRLGVRLSALEVESFPLVRSLLPGEERPVLLVDVGDRTTSFSVVDGGYLRLNQAMDLGGAALTEAIATRFSISQEEAETRKKAEGVSRARGTGAAGLPATESPTTVSATLRPVLTEIVQRGEVLRRLYKRKRGRELARVVLIGGGARLPGLASFWTEVSGLPTEVENPWRGISAPKVLTEQLRILGPSFAVAVGLALRPLRKT